MAAAAVLAALSLSFNAVAGNRDKARAGVMAGFTSSSSNAKNVDASSIGRYHVGLTAELPIAYGFAVQPSVLFQSKGTKLSDIGPEKFRLDARASYLEVPVQVQWGPDLVAFRPYVFAEPFIGYGLFAKAKRYEAEAAPIKSSSFKGAGMSRWEYGLGLGAGIDIWKIQFSVKYFWNFGSLYSESGKMNDVGETVKDAFKDGRNFNGVTFSLAFMF
mgnify:CR=1 FL=1